MDTMFVAGPPPPPRRPGGHWVFTAVTSLLTLLSIILIVQGWSDFESCYRPPEPCEPSGRILLTSMLSLGLLAAVPVTMFIGLCVGVSEGRRRHPFAHRRFVAAVIVGVCTPWALAAYAVGYGGGRLLPRHVTPVPEHVRAAEEGFQAAVSLYGILAAGHRPLPVVSPFVGGAPAFLDATFGYARYYGMDVSYTTGGRFAYGSPGFVAGTMLAGMAADAATAARARRMAQAQWREHTASHVVVTATTTWCEISGRWLRFDHDAVMEYLPAADSLIMTFADTEPVRLVGSGALCHAVLFAYLRFGEPAWRSAPFLGPIAAAHAIRQ